MTRIFTLLISLTFSSISFADFEKGWDCVQQQDFACALKELKPLADQGHMDAQYLVGYMYTNGQGVKQDDLEAVKYYKLAAVYGHSFSQAALGSSYEFGFGVKQDKLEAKRLYGLACDNRNASGCKNYKILNEQGY